MNFNFLVNFPFKLEVKLAVHSSLKVNPGLKNKHWTWKLLIGFERMFDVFIIIILFIFFCGKFIKVSCIFKSTSIYILGSNLLHLQGPDFETWLTSAKSLIYY